MMKEENIILLTSTQRTVGISYNKSHTLQSHIQTTKGMNLSKEENCSSFMRKKGVKQNSKKEKDIESPSFHVSRVVQEEKKKV